MATDNETSFTLVIVVIIVTGGIWLAPGPWNLVIVALGGFVIGAAGGALASKEASEQKQGRADDFAREMAAVSEAMETVRNTVTEYRARLERDGVAPEDASVMAKDYHRLILGAIDRRDKQ